MTRFFRTLPVVLVIALAMSAARCAGPAPATSSSGPPPFAVVDTVEWRTDGLRIGTFNGEFLFDGEGDEGEATFAWKGDPAKARAHRARVAQSVRKLDVDILLMPETENLNALQMLVDESLTDLGYTAHLVDGLDSFTGQDVGLLSRVPVEETGRTNERALVGVSDRQYGVSKNLWARMDLPLGDELVPVTLIGVHFLARPDDVERRDRREAQAEVIRQLAEQESAAGRQLILLGDFNDFDESVLDRRSSTPITDVLAILKRVGPGEADDLVNVMGDVPQAERYTALYDRNGNDIIDEGELSAIDHILLSPGLYERVREVRYAPVHDPRRVSDHFPLVVTLN
ncbi:MAG: hypothetical protein Rubg2KO_00480 [Rubricoccaceae bacterium]